MNISKTLLLAAVAGTTLLGGPLVAGAVQAAPMKEPVASVDYKAAPSGNYSLDKNHTTLQWSVSHMGMSHYMARFENVDGTLTYDAAKPTASSLAFTVKTDEIESASSKLDEELKGEKFFNTAKFPTATFKSTRLVLSGKNTGKLTGDLTLLGVTKPVTFDITLNGVGKNFEGQPTMGFGATGLIHRSDFGMTEYAGVVGDVVTLKLEAEFNQKSPVAAAGE